jgi:glucose/arabinose dehydrogenase
MGPMRRRALIAVLAVVAVATLGLVGCTVPPPIRVETVLGGLDHPWDLGFTPNGTILLTERPGPISAIVGGQKRVLADPPDVVAASEAGMMGLAIDPFFSLNRFLFTCFASTLGGPGNDVRLVRWRVSADFTTLTSRKDIITGLPVNTAGQLGRHSGCRPRFGPDDRLWVGTGDAAVGTVPQDPHSLGGKVLRVNRFGQGVPGNPGGALDPRIFSYGHRNVQGIAFRPGTGRPFSVEHGPDRDDEVNRPRAGRNYGWDPVPGYNEAVPMTDLGKFPDAVPAVWSSGAPPIAPSGATFLTGARWGAWDGALAITALRGEQLRVLSFSARRAEVLRDQTAITNRGRLRSPVQGPDGNLYLTTDIGGGGGSILRVIPS